MAKSSPSSWSETERVNVDLTPIAQGSPSFSTAAARAAMSPRPGIEVQQASASPADSRDLFFEGVIGASIPGTPEQIMSIIGSRVASETLGIPAGASNLSFRHSETSLTGSHIKGRQMVGSLPVYGSDITSHVDIDGRPYAITGRPFPEVLTQPLRQPDRLHPNPLAVIEQYLELKLDHQSAKINQVALLIETEFVACFHVMAASVDRFGVWSAFLTFAGEPLAAFNIASSLYGEAMANVENPFRGTAVRARLDNLIGPGPTTLHGSYARVKAWQGEAALGMNGLFLYNEAARRFDEPCVYYYLDQARIAFEVLTRAPFAHAGHFTQKANFNPMQAFTHVTLADAADNAFYSPLDGRLYFGDINIDENERFTSWSRDIAVHEFGHAVSDSICRLGRTQAHAQSRAMSEGYSDYFAASFLDNPVIGDYFMNEPGGFRTCDHTKRFPAGYAGEEHDVGEIWAGFLWSLRQDQAIGAGVADVLALESLHFLGPWRTIPQGVEAVVQADRRLFPGGGAGAPGRHEQRIRTLFQARRP